MRAPYEQERDATELPLDNILPEVFLDVLTFIYTNEVEVNNAADCPSWLI
mgnify:CR=1 FL=1